MLRKLLAFLSGFIAFFVTSGVYYGVIVYDAQMEVMEANPDAFHAEPKVGLIILANLLWVGMVQYVIEASSKKGVVWGAIHGGLTLLLVNGGFNFLILGGFKFIPMNFALLDIAVNVIFGVAAGAAIALVSGRASA